MTCKPRVNEILQYLRNHFYTLTTTYMITGLGPVRINLKEYF